MELSKTAISVVTKFWKYSVIIPYYPDNVYGNYIDFGRSISLMEKYRQMKGAGSEVIKDVK